MYYITYSEYYPIWEAAEGGYYYEGKQVLEVRTASTFRKARQILNSWRKQCKNDLGYWENNRSNYISFGQSSKYIGDGYIAELTREPIEEYGYHPYE